MNDSKHYALCSYRKHKWPLGVVIQRGPSASFVLYSLIQILETEGLGSGAFGKVYKACYNDKMFAAKIIEKRMIKDKGLEKPFSNEVDLQFSLDHPHIIKLHHIAESDSSLVLLFDIASRGNLSGR